MPTGAGVLVCYNPISGRGRGVAVAEALGEALPGADVEGRRAKDLPPEVWRDRRAVVAVGGDGTIRGVVAAMLRALPEDPTPPVCVAGLGTANLLAQHLGHQPPGLLHVDPLGWLRHTAVLEPHLAAAAAVARFPAREQAAAVVRALRAGRVRRVDVAHAGGGGEGGGEGGGGGLMLLMAGVGLDGDVIHAMQLDRAGPITKAQYLPAAARAALAFDFPRLRVEVDGRAVGAARGVAFVANVPEYGTGFPLLPGARSDDGRLDVALLPCAGRVELAGLVALAVAGRHHEAAGAVVRRGRRVRIEADPPAQVQIDGEAAGRTPLAVEVAPRQVRFLLPA